MTAGPQPAPEIRLVEINAIGTKVALTDEGRDWLVRAGSAL